MVLQDSLPRCFEAAFYIEMQTDRTTEILVATKKLEASPTVEENSGSIHMIKKPPCAQFDWCLYCGVRWQISHFLCAQKSMPELTVGGR